jgi:ParB-like chromosome segregation protein Spo0J
MHDVVRMLPQRYEPHEDLSELLPFPGNPKDHDQGAIAESIDALGFFGAILAQEYFKYVLAGHGRLEDLRRRGITTGPVLWVKCGPEVARSIVLADNRIGERGGWNDPALGAFLATQVRSYGDASLAGTGFDLDDVEALRDRLEPLQFSSELRIRIGNPHHSATIQRAIEILLAKHPEWRAQLEAA